MPLRADVLNGLDRKWFASEGQLAIKIDNDWEYSRQFNLDWALYMYIHAHTTETSWKTWNSLKVSHLST